MNSKLYTLILFFSLCGLVQAHAQAPDSATCTAQFYASPSGNTVYFRAADSLTGVQHFWSFGDTTQVGFGNYVGVTHTYRGPGNYTVIHLIRNTATGCHDSSAQTITIAAPPPTTCSISFYYFRDSTHRPSVYHFTAQPVLAGATHDTVSWSVNGTAAGVGDSLTRSFTPGTYTICVYLNTNLCRSQQCQTINVTDSVGGPVPPDSIIRVPPDSIVTVPPDSIGKVPPDSIIRVPPDSIGKLPPDSIGIVPPDSIGTRPDSTYGADSLAHYVPSYPNPTSNQVYMDVRLDKAEMIYIRVYNSMGNQVQQVSVSGMQGNNHLSLPIAGLQSGIYYIQIQYGNVTSRSRIQKL